MTIQVFVSYRRGDGAHAAGRLVDRLDEHFKLFLDVDRIKPGANFTSVVREAVDKSDVLVAVIGLQWLTLTAANGGRRIDQPGDWVAEEIGTALRRGTLVIPVLVDGAQMPSGDELPPGLADLANRQALRVSHESFAADSRRLIETIEEMVSAATSETVNLWDDSDYPQARGAFLQGLWPAAIEGFERVLHRHPRQQHVVEQLEQARRSQHLLDLAATAESATDADRWQEVVDTLKAIDALQPSDEVKNRLSQAQLRLRINELRNDVRAFAKTGNWKAVLAADAELARLDAEAADPDGLATRARAKLLEAELAADYARAVRQLDDRDWAGAESTLVAVLDRRAGYRDAEPLLGLARRKGKPEKVEPAVPVPTAAHFADAGPDPADALTARLPVTPTGSTGQPADALTATLPVTPSGSTEQPADRPPPRSTGVAPPGTIAAGLPPTEPKVGGPRRSGRVRVLAVVLAAVLLGVGVGVAFTLRNRPASTAETPVNSIPPTESSALDKTPTPSPTRTPTPAAALPRSADPLADEVLVWPRVRDGNWDIALLDVDSGKETPLTRSPLEDTVPMLTRDRRTIVYSQNTDDDRQLRVMGADGRGDRVLWDELPDGCSSMRRPAQTPDGDFVALCSVSANANSKLSLNLVAVDGKRIRRLDEQAWMGDVTVTRDGKSVIYWRNTVDTRDGGALYRVALDGKSKPVRITDGGPGEHAGAVVSPDGSQIAYRRRVGNNRIIVTAGFDGKNLIDPEDRTSSDLVSQDPSWSPDGSRIAFKRGFNEDADLRVLDLKSGDVLRVIDNDEPELSPAWTPR